MRLFFDGVVLPTAVLLLLLLPLGLLVSRGGRKVQGSCRVFAAASIASYAWLNSIAVSVAIGARVLPW
jgi:hypothetical protein